MKSTKKVRKSGSIGGRVRIIGGQWRGRKLPVITATGLRPTGDRVRETVFNWLQTFVPGANCLDLFAGTGALGFEAASRGAASVTLVEHKAEVADQLRQSMQLLQCGDSIRLEQSSAQAFLSSNSVMFDLVFLDPPFSEQLHADILQQQLPKHLSQNARVYVEVPCAESTEVAQSFNGYEVLRQKQFGDVNVFLLQALRE